MKPTKKFEGLVEIVKVLRKECPWDRSQTHESIKDDLIEETYEAIETIDQEDYEGLKEELGDLLLHIVFHSRMSAETNDFTIEDVIYNLQEKLIDRHPHVFGNAKVTSKQEVAKNWEQLKMDEGRGSILDGIPKRLPALIRAQRMQEKAGSVDFDWKKAENGKEQLWQKLLEEFNEFKEAYQIGNAQQINEEYGDLLFSIVNVGRFLELQAEDGLREANRKFENRFRYIEEQVGTEELNNASLEEMERLWQEAKKVMSNK